MNKAFSVSVLVLGFWITDATAAAPSFDCRKATKPDEKAICQNTELAQNDQSTTRLFKRLKKAHRQVALSIARLFRT